MVTLQILVLPFLVRIRVPQQTKIKVLQLFTNCSTLILRAVLFLQAQPTRGSLPQRYFIGFVLIIEIEFTLNKVCHVFNRHTEI